MFAYCSRAANLRVPALVGLLYTLLFGEAHELKQNEK